MSDLKTVAQAIEFDKKLVISKARVSQNFANGQGFLKLGFEHKEITLTPVAKYTREVRVGKERVKVQEVQGIVFVESATNKRVTLTWDDLGAMIAEDGGSLLEDRGTDTGFYETANVPIIQITSSEAQQRGSHDKYALKYYEDDFAWASFSAEFDSKVDEVTGEKELTPLGFEQMNKRIAEMTSTGELHDGVIGATDKAFKGTGTAIDTKKVAKYKGEKVVVYPARTFQVTTVKVA